MMAPLYGTLQERHRVLSRIAHALRDVRPSVRQHYKSEAPAFSGYAEVDTVERREQTIARFMERSADYKATVLWVDSEEHLPDALAYGVDMLSLQRIVVPAELDMRWLTSLDENSLTLLQDEPLLSKEELDTLDGVITASSVAIAETGTIALDHGPNQGRRIISLLPPCHLCVVYAQDVVSGVPEAIKRLKPALAAGKPVTWISGPSATVDIEFTRVVGVHGPHKLMIFVVGQSG